ncbi:MAG: hypothetical protein ABI548_25310 [Polyangiaceae bacterium]
MPAESISMSENSDVQFIVASETLAGKYLLLVPGTPVTPFDFETGQEAFDALIARGLIVLAQVSP